MGLFRGRIRSSDATRKDKKDASGDPDDAFASELVELANDVERICRQTRVGGYEKAAPQWGRIQEIGRLLHEEGGLERMRAVHARARAKEPSQARYLEREWGGIGMWMG